MSERDHTLAYALGHVNAAYIAEAEIPALTAAAVCPCRGGKYSLNALPHARPHCINSQDKTLRNRA